jgi:hypothetical protein
MIGFMHEPRGLVFCALALLAMVGAGDPEASKSDALAKVEKIQQKVSLDDE